MQTKISRFAVALLGLLLVSSSFAATLTTSQQLEKAKQLYAQKKDDEAMDLFVDVLVNGNRAEVEEANKYINLIHNHMGGIEDPIEVSADFQEGEPTRLPSAQDPAVLEQQLAAQAAAVPQELVEGDPYAAPSAQAMQYVEPEYDPYADPYTDFYNGPYADAYDEYAVMEDPSLTGSAESLYVQQGQQNLPQQDIILQPVTSMPAAGTQTDSPYYEDDFGAGMSTNSTYIDLTSPEALQVRELYTEQKIDSMTEASVARLKKMKGVRVYFRDDLPDAIDIDSEVLFNGYKFRPEAYEVLDEVYTLMTLTQGAGYIILPPGSYTDNITLPGIRQAMALNSYLVHKGLSSGKISYNMGLFDEEPPAKFANLEGISIVFDYDAPLPAALPEAASISELPMLSMAVVPVSHKIDLTAGEAFVIDFSVLETANELENWVFQIIQHGKDGQYYIVRQLDGFSPVYHQLLWNGRKGIIGPALACGKYTLVLTAKDIKEGKKTLRRQIELKCPAVDTQEQTNKKAKSKAKSSKKLNYKSARLWKKPGRTMKQASAKSSTTTTTVIAAEPEIVDPFANSHTETTHETVYRELADGSIEERTTTTTTTTNNSGVTTTTAAPTVSVSSSSSSSNSSSETAAEAYEEAAPVNPYDMPYEEF